MKYITTKKSSLSKALMLILFLTSAYTYTNNHAANIDSVIQIFGPAEKNLAEFFNSNVATSYNTLLYSLKTILHDFQRKVETITRTPGDELAQDMAELMDYVSQHFNILCNILQKYNGKPDSYALEFSVEIKREFNTEKIFGEMISKLRIIKDKAEKAGEKELTKKISCFMLMIQKKKAEWSAKPEWVLFAGLKKRMNCR
jgi:hypothetical protein